MTATLPKGWTPTRGAACSPLAALGVSVHFDPAVRARLLAEQLEAERLFDHEDSASELTEVSDFLRGQGMLQMAGKVRQSIERHDREIAGKDIPDLRPRVDLGFLILRGEGGAPLLQCPWEDVPSTAGFPWVFGTPVTPEQEKWKKRKRLDLGGTPLVVAFWEWTGPPGLVSSLVFSTAAGEVEWPRT